MAKNKNRFCKGNTIFLYTNYFFKKNASASKKIKLVDWIGYDGSRNDTVDGFNGRRLYLIHQDVE